MNVWRHNTSFMTWLAPRALWQRGCATFIPVIACTRLSVSVNEQKKLASTSPSLLSPHAIFRAFFRSVVPTIMKPGTGCAIPVHSPCCRVQRQTPYSRKGVSLNSWLMSGYLFIYYKARVSKTSPFLHTSLHLQKILRQMNSISPHFPIYEEHWLFQAIF